ncbi:phosphoribosyl-ATP diphosphatase [uncultured Clostridium sp.]|jgi:phosphoribosyl-ATP pyrophosphohydrolase|uniref:phosphoribosyl-ATP diphosphatase n=1 Tax=uncultured Clostridium sp. TaxID=59620 RepID=UPI0026339311|nr:phosphoribosyl-ATP diphosphatase [uncultured Clostridium sp.]
MDKSIENLYSTILDRKENKFENSYTNYLFDKGIDKILKKFGEESVEVIIAAKNSDKNEQTEEFSDLIYHMLVLMAQLDISTQDISNNIELRNKKMGNLKTERKDIEII